MRFRLMTKDASGNKAGVHHMGPVNPKTRRWAKTIRPGEIVESDEPLDELFRNKFERLPDITPEPEAEPTAKRTRRK